METIIHERAHLCDIIRAWSTGPRIFTPHPDPAVERERRFITDGMYDMAIRLSNVLRAPSLVLLEHFIRYVPGYEEWAGAINAATENGIDPLESRNGYELWQAFLIVARLASYGELRVSNQFVSPNADPEYVQTMRFQCDRIGVCARQCAAQCLLRRHNMPLPNPRDVHVIIQILEVEPSDSPYAVQCLNDAIRLLSTSSGPELHHARHLFAYHLSEIQRWGFPFNNVRLLEQAITDLTASIALMDQRATMLEDRTANLPPDLYSNILRFL